MAEHAMDGVEVYVELGQKLVFAGALDWPGWARSGRGEPAALQALWTYGPRYDRVFERGRDRVSRPGERVGVDSV